MNYYAIQLLYRFIILFTESNRFGLWRVHILRNRVQRSALLFPRQIIRSEGGGLICMAHTG